MSLVFSHTTALLAYRAPNRPALLERFPAERLALDTGYPSKRSIVQAKSMLRAMGIPASELQTVDVLVSRGGNRSCDPSVSSHCCSAALPAHAVCRLAPGMFVVCPELCFIQMAETLVDKRELIDLGYELCGGYEFPADGEGDYRERAPLTSASAIGIYIGASSGIRGTKTARWALSYVRDGSRSPMETAHAMTLALPRRMGGLGVRRMCMDYRVDVPAVLRRLTKKHYVVCDACVPTAKLDIEYNGFHHDEERRKAEDEERRNALEAMGFRVKVLTKAAFFDGGSFRRHLHSIMTILRIQTRDLPSGFWDRQDELRRFVLRRWL